MTDKADALGSNIKSDPLPPGPPTDVAESVYVMASGEPFTREQYHDAGWSDEQLLAAGKMSPYAASSRIDLSKPLGMPESTWIVLDDNDDIPPTGLFVGHNGTGFLIQTGVPVLVPNHVLNVLDDAIMDSPVIDGASRKIMSYRPRPRYTYRRVSAPADA